MIKKILLLTMFSTVAMATTRYVDLNSLSPTPPYTSWATAARNIQDAVTVSVENDTVVVTNGHYLLSAEISVNEAITIQSVNGYDFTTIDGQWLHRGFNLGAINCVISGFKIFRGYSQYSGGGIYCEFIEADQPSQLITDCLIEQCHAGTKGGGADDGKYEHCIFKDNQAGQSGGGLSGNALANGCLFYGNHATGDGGGMYYCTANSCTVVNNTADGDGGGVAGPGWTSNGSYGMKLNNSIVWYNTDTNNKNTYNTTSVYSCSPDLSGTTGSITSAPLFVDRINGNYRLASNSPCIDIGSNPHAQTTTDIDGNPRYVNGQVDMGAYEYQGDQGSSNLTVRVILESSSDLNTWTNTGKEIEWIIPANSSNGFYRARVIL